MGILDKIMFWKKDDFSDLDFGSGSDPFADTSHTNAGLPETPSVDSAMPSNPTSSYGQPEQPPQEPQDYSSHDSFSHPMGQPFQGASFSQSNQSSNQSSQSNMSNYTVGKEIEIISSKLDALRASLDSINQRIANLERMAEADSNRRRGW